MRKIFPLIAAIVLLVPALASASDGMKVDYEVGGQTFEGYYISFSNDAPFILLVHDWDGLNDYEITRARMLAKLGYAVFCVDMFGKGVAADTMDKRKALTGALYQDRERMRALMLGGLAKAKELGANVTNGVAMGYCFGGTCVLELARTGTDLKAFVTFHGGLATPEGQDYAKTKGFVLVFHGTADAAVSMDDFAALAKELEGQGVRHEMTTYSGAPHAFTVFGSDRYREDADRKSWARFTGFLDQTLK